MLPVQTGTGDPSPENIRPIYGHASATAHRTGKNLLENTGAASTTIHDVTFTKSSDGTVTANGTATADAHYSISIDLPAGDYLVSGCADGGGTGKYNVYVWDLTSQSRPTQWDGVAPSISIIDSTTMAQIKIESGHSYVFRLRVYSGYTANSIVFKPMICVSAETDATFVTYNGDTYTVSFGQTVYGGTLDCVTGVLTATWGYIASYNGETLPAEWISDRDVYAAGTTPTTGAEVAYRLATPQTFQLTPQETTTLLGQNNIWVTTTTNVP